MTASPKMCAALLLSLLLSAGAAAQSQSTYTNPVMAGDYPDPSVIRVRADFWALTTTGGWAPHFSILRSTDLVNWRVVGAVFQTPPLWVKDDFWAPEIREDKGRYFVFYTARRNDGPRKRGTLCVAVATANAPAGPYTDHGALVCQISELKNVGSIDAFFVRDENDDPYLIWKADGNDAEPDEPTSIFAQRLAEDGTKLLGKRKEILRNTAAWEKHVTEGSYIIRRNGWFYHFYSGNACCGRSCEYALGVARSRKLLGPWEKNPANPIIAANETWQCPGHGSIVTTSDGRDFLLYHAYRKRADAFSIGREAVLDEVKWNENGWPSVNEGRGPSGTAPAPMNLPNSSASMEFFDGFTNPELDASWQWPMQAKQTARVDVASGYLVLAPGGTPQNTDNLTGAVLAQRTSSGNYVATTVVDARGLTAGATAGLAAYSWRDAAVGITLGGGRVFVWHRDGQNQQTPAATPAPNAPLVYLRMTVTDGEQFRFTYSVNGRDWKELGEAVYASNIEGAHVALTAGGTGARFDWVKITPKEK
ncbi:MAG: xylan 1,4-beta-xylosidase [Acidobacteriota bacterium]|jgi:beta-xylosidase|nr:xylan 1,4-beta-xylosidase [Acidobacteriota bacterium]